MTSGSRKTARSRIKSSVGYNDDNVHPQNKHTHILRKNRSGDIISIRTMKTLLIGFGIFSFTVVSFLMYNHLTAIDRVKELRITTPLNAAKMMDLAIFQGDHKESLYWGSYRPHVYLGIRARTSRSLIAGLMWIGVKDGKYSMRHVCQDSDGLSTYGWTHHNGRDYGHQLLVDQDITLETSFLKSKVVASGYGGDWAVRVAAQDKISAFGEDNSWIQHIFFYIADEEGNALKLGQKYFDFHRKIRLSFGSRKDIGDWELHLDSIDNLSVHFSGFRTPYFHNLTELVQTSLATHATQNGRFELPDTIENLPNVLVFQISGKLPYKVDIAFVSGIDTEHSDVERRVHSLTGSLLTNLLHEKQKEFEENYRTRFNVSEKVDSDTMVVGRTALANLLGGIGYFYGQSKISLPRSLGLKNGASFVHYWPSALYTAVPSRSYFPRGFLWDEGFHQLIVWRWDVYICLDTIGHWLDLINADGWIPREQILGAEARSKVPEEFVPQHTTNGNPPTLFLVIHDLINAVREQKFTSSEVRAITSFLDRAFARLESWFQWFNSKQSGMEANSYYWHGRDNDTTRELNPKTLSSGLDDYPRSSHPTNEERHLDLRCWMLLAASCMHSLAVHFGKDSSKIMEYYNISEQLSNLEILNQMHFDNDTGAYFDFGYHTEKVRLRWHEVMGSSESQPKRELIREVLEEPQLRLVPHVGYVSLFPFMMKIIPSDSWILEKQLDIISNRSILWTDYGLRSLSRTSSLYMKRNTEHDPPYWRGPIWINMNYMILSALRHYSQVDGPYKDRAQHVYEELRKNLIRNIVDKYVQTGYLWEQYDQKNRGQGKGTRPFTGWTSLILLIMGEIY